MRRHRRAIIIGLVCGLFAERSAAVAASPGAIADAPTALSTEDQKQIGRIVDYLDALRSEKSHFVQTDGRGARSEGTFYLQRPGRARFEYDPPSGLVIAADGRYVTVVDRRLKTKHVYPLSSTPLNILLARNIRLDRGVAVRQVIREAGAVTVIAEDAHGKARGQIALTFSQAPLALTGWEVKDGRGAAITVRLSELAAASPHDASFFELADPRMAHEPDVGTR